MGAYFHRMATAVSEGLAFKNETIEKIACGNRNRANFKVAICLHCGSLLPFPGEATVTH